MKRFNLVGIGEVLWDLLPSGPQLGGAPANFTYHANALGARASLITRIGTDEWGNRCAEQLNALGLSPETVQLDPQAPTSTVRVVVRPDGNPEYTIFEKVAWDRLAVTDAALATVRAADAICFGTLGQRDPVARAAILRLVSATPKATLRIFDINLRQHYFTREVITESLELANVLKVNETELPVLAELLGCVGDERAQIRQIADEFSLCAVAYTRGGQGSLLCADRGWSDHPGVATEVVDTVGAGDSFTAAMTLGLLRGWNLDVINARANAVAAHVASCAGATPKLPIPLTTPFLETPV